MTTLIVRGNPADGFEFVGPFAARDLAVCYLSEEPGRADMWVTDLLSPSWIGEQMDIPEENWDKAFAVTQLGRLDHGIDGSDFYALVRRVDGEFLTPDLAQRFYLSRVYREGHGPGQVFCHCVRVIKEGMKNDTAICIAEQRYDV